MSSAIIVPNYVEDDSQISASIRGRRPGQIVATYGSREPINAIATHIDNLSGRTAETEEVQSSAKNTFFYRRKLPIDLTYRALTKFVKKSGMTEVFEDYKTSMATLGKIGNDINILMLSDFTKNNLPFRLGSSPGCDHIQIDESKFGKRKHHRGHRVEGVWVFGMVEAIKVGEEMKKHRGVWYKKPIFSAGRLFDCTVPNRTTATLKPIIEAHCVRGSVTRSDGWGVYTFMHPADIQLPDGTYQDNTQAYQDGDYFFRQHHVVNHSENFATEDQVKGNHTEGLIHTNLIEGMWLDVKKSIAPCYRNEEFCADKLLEYLWRRENKNVYDSLNRALKEVEFPSSLDDLDSLVVITRGLNGLSEVDQARHNERLERRRAATIRRNRNAANPTSEANNKTESSGSDSQEETTSHPSDSSSDEDSDFSDSGNPVGGPSPQDLNQNQPVTPNNGRSSFAESSVSTSEIRRTTRASVAQSGARNHSVSGGPSSSRRPVGRPPSTNKRVRVSSGTGPGRPSGSRTRPNTEEELPAAVITPSPRPVGRPRSGTVRPVVAESSTQHIRLNPRPSRK
ncbi:hypothetical protein INT47_006629 [Mucor saturninus]|uniref:ISXO2-like transposase domain-containing protein n=1 Tax=Mucor saturninus TaxID=64648 RepID=A0A8H7US16_9FUNG|nr:hypothetical protein INT47_006629 [Mucor saturninus]